MSAHALRPGGGPAGPADFARFRDVDAWVFDLDNTLYPGHLDIFPQVQARIADFVQRLLGLAPEEAERVQKDYYLRYGATLRGLIVEHGLEPDGFLEYVHDVDHSELKPDPALAERIGRLPGRRFILTNGSRRHAEKIAERLGVTEHFEDIFDIVWAGHLPKPAAETYHLMIERTGIDPARTAMFEDLSRNLLVPHRLGMTTVLVVPAGTEAALTDSADAVGVGLDQVDFVTGDLTGFLEAALAATTIPPR